MFGDLENKSKEVAEKLKSIEVQESLDGIVLKGNASGEIEDISIPEGMDIAQVEDVMIVLVNRFSAKAKEIELTEQQSILNDMLGGIGGMDALGGMFG